MNTPTEDKQTDSRKFFIQKCIQPNCSQLTNNNNNNLSTEQGAGDLEICTLTNNIDEMDNNNNKKPSGGRSWTRSKRISLGCLEWRSRGPTRQTTDLGSCNRINYITRTGSSHGCCAVHSEDDYAYTNAEVEEVSKMKVKNFSPKCRQSGADNLLQRLRRRSFSRDKNNKRDINSRSNSPRSVYSYESCTELEGNCAPTVGGNNYSLLLLQMNKCNNNLSVTNLLPQMSLSRSVPELKSHNCFIDSSLSSSCLYHEMEKSLHYLKNYENTSTYQCSFMPSNKIANNNNNSIELTSTSPLSIKENSSTIAKQYCQSNLEPPPPPPCSLLMNTSHYAVNTSACDSSHLGFNLVVEDAEVPQTMKYSDSLVLFSREGQQQQQQQQQRYDFSSNPLVASIYSEVCPNCRYNNPAFPMNSNNDTGKQYNSYGRTNCLKHSGVCDSNNLSDTCSDMKTSGEKPANMQIANLNTSSVSSSYTPTNATNNLSNVDNNPSHYQTLINTGVDNTDLHFQTQHNSSCQSLRPDSLLSTSTTTTRESSSSYSDLSPNSMSSHDSALGGGGKSQSDNAGVLKKTMCPVTVTATTANCPKTIEHMKYVKSADIVACVTSSVMDHNKNNINTQDFCHIPPMCLPPSGNYSCSHTTPPTPIRRPWLGDNNNTEQMPSGRSRSGDGQQKKPSVYVNASSICSAIPEMLLHQHPPDSNGGYNRRISRRIRDRQQNSYENAAALVNIDPTSTSTVDKAVTTSNNNSNNASNPQIPYWTRLLPYRTSTVPQNLSGRLRKSETLPNDWATNSSSSYDLEHEKKFPPPLPTKSTSYQLQPHTLNQNAHQLDESKPHSFNQYSNNDDDTGINNGKGGNNTKSAQPPRPPIRTSSHSAGGSGGGSGISRQTPMTQASASASPCCHHLSCQKQRAQGLLNSSTNNVNDEGINESPVLCRYSQLYCLNTQTKINSCQHNSASSQDYHSTSPPQQHNPRKHPPSVHYSPHHYSPYEHQHPPQPHHHRQQFIQCPILQSHSNPSSQRNHCDQLVELDIKKLEINGT
ncbi:unnamed protein product [Trichobilharzia szidati]|nr:unnamed protein product [Trichobilharzia szidati]